MWVGNAASYVYGELRFVEVIMVILTSSWMCLFYVEEYNTHLLQHTSLIRYDSSTRASRKACLGSDIGL